MDLESLILKGVDAVFGASGLAVRDGLRHNPQQHDYAQRAARGFCRYDAENERAALNMLQAATGLGKTLAYLVPAMLYAAHTGKRIAVSTFTRQLQRQILIKDAPRAAAWIEELTAVRLSTARRIGRANYVSESGCLRLKGLLLQENKAVYEDAIEFLDDLVDWCDEEDGTGVLDDFMDDMALESLPDGIVRSFICLDASSLDEDACRFEADVAASKQSDVLICNHALMVMHAYRWSSILDGDERKTALVVFDEADCLPEVASSLLSSNLPLHRLLSISQSVATHFNLPALSQSVERLHGAAMDEHVPNSRIAAISNAGSFGRSLGEANAIVAKTARLLSEERGLFAEKGIDEAKRRLAAEFLDLASDLDRVQQAMSNGESTAMLSWSPIRAFPSLVVGNPAAGRIMSRLWRTQAQDDSLEPRVNGLECALFTSATLATPGRRYPEAFDDFSNSIGVVRHPPRRPAAEAASADSLRPIHNVQTDLFFNFQPRRFGSMRFVLADPSVPNPTLIVGGVDTEAGAESNPEWLDYCATMVRTAQSRGGRTLVLTLSWRDTEALEQRLLGVDNLLVQHRRQPLRPLLSMYRDVSRPNAVLISPGAWEGVDEPGRVNNLVITRIPFLPPNRLSQVHERIHLSAKGYEASRIDSLLAARDMGKTRRKLEQGLGRGLRSPTDSVTVFIADPRFPMPEAMQASLDPILMKAPARKSRGELRSCIPARFLANEQSYPAAQLCLASGELHTVL